ncbi:MAG: 16S rRNA (cytosine(1402)-N(4))-methyltransferase RsmH [Deltaproteobacteria bacterium]|nr:16S rRNA (cytosine(1402)-N(4))-methyltransferase RsmH [Deltaproteobacteria bacterium]
MRYPHKPVLAREAADLLVYDPEGTYVDGTAGSGGHSEVLASLLAAGGRLICLDRDPDAVSLTSRRMLSFGDRVLVLQGSYAHLDRHLETLGMRRVEGILLDLGMSTHQLERSGRGFAFSRDEPLDMRMDPGRGETAAEMLNRLPIRDLERIIRTWGEDRRARRIAGAIVRARKRSPIETTRQLASLIESLSTPGRRRGRIHPATRTFQALRIAVNRELDHLAEFLEKAPSLVNKGGRLVILSYHSLEDRMVKQAMRRWENPCTCPPDIPRCVCNRPPLFRSLRKKAIKAGADEVRQNPRARSAVLRAAERI